MKRGIFAGAILALALVVAPAVHAQYTQLQQGSQIKLTLLTGLSTAVARDGDAFTAVVAEPVFLGNQLILPAGTKVHGQVGAIVRPRRFSLIRGESSMNLVFRSLEVDSRIIPVQLSILSIYNGDSDTGKRRKDVKTVEGVVVEEKHDIKGDVMAAGLGTGGGSLVGLVFSNVVRGFGIGLAGSAAYIMAKKGKEVELPAQTGILVRTDSTVSIPAVKTAGYSSGAQ